MDGPNASVPVHSHDWPVLALYVVGSYRNRTVAGEVAVGSPSVMLYRRDEDHQNLTGPHGLEQVAIEFDPIWLGHLPGLEDRPVRLWIGGGVASAGRRLASLWSSRATHEWQLTRATQALLRTALQVETVRQPVWMADLESLVQADPRISTRDLARELRLRPSWLAAAYRGATGEGLAERLARSRVEAAMVRLRLTDWPAAEVAAVSGFCDQSHMIRAFRKFLGRTPAQVRGEVALMRTAGLL
jgi:AraC family transcriptional regulator